MCIVISESCILTESTQINLYRCYNYVLMVIILTSTREWNNIESDLRKIDFIKAFKAEKKKTGMTFIEYRSNHGILGRLITKILSIYL